MAVEIERRFLVTDQGWRSHLRWGAHIVQGYLVADHNGLVLRVRSSETRPEGATQAAGAAEPGATRASLTLKAPDRNPAARGGALSRLEFEYAIPPGDARALLALSPHQLSKSRYGLNLPAGDWVVDVFEAANAPLMVAEVELSHPDQVVAIPSWCGREITGRHELSNAALAARPLQRWSAAERAALLAPEL